MPYCCTHTCSFRYTSHQCLQLGHLFTMLRVNHKKKKLHDKSNHDQCTKVFISLQAVDRKKRGSKFVWSGSGWVHAKLREAQNKRKNHPLKELCQRSQRLDFASHQTALNMYELGPSIQLGTRVPSANWLFWSTSLFATHWTLKCMYSFNRNIHVNETNSHAYTTHDGNRTWASLPSANWLFYLTSLCSWHWTLKCMYRHISSRQRAGFLLVCFYSWKTSNGCCYHAVMTKGFSMALNP